MAISVDWAAKIIFVPQADLTALSGGIFELDLDVFRLALKTLEASEEGMPFDDTHRHTAPLPISNIVLARVVEIINGYTVTFEDLQYAVNLIGANTNLQDIANVNQVSIRTGNTAGLIQTTPEITQQDLSDSITNLQRIIESQRGSHSATGIIFYWDPINGDDSNDGLSPLTQKLTWGGASGINSVVTPFNHDVVMISPGESGGATIITEQIVLDKEYTFIRGPGRDVIFQPTATTGETVSIEGEGCELSGVKILTAATGDGEALVVTANFCKISNVWVELSQGDGIRLQNVSFSKLKDIFACNCVGNGIVFRGITQDCKFNILSDCQVILNSGNGIVFEGINCQYNYVWGGEDGVSIETNLGWGILEQTNADFNHVVGPIIHMGDNTLGNIQFAGVNSVSENINDIAENVWTQSGAGFDQAGTFGAKIHLIERILRNKLVTDPVTGIMTLFDDAGFPLLTAQLFEDVAGSQNYRGQGAERRERLE